MSGVSPKLCTIMMVLGLAAGHLMAIPRAESIQPSSGSGNLQVFTIEITNPGGVSGLNVVNLLVNSGLDASNACYLAFQVSTGSIYLVGDSGSGLLGPITASGDGAIANTQCTVYATGSFMSSLSPDRLAIGLHLSFSSAFVGPKVLHVAASDQLGANSGWQRIGVWENPSGQITSPRTIGLRPRRSEGYGPTPISIDVRHTSTQSRSVSVLFNDGLDGNNACWFGFHEPSASLILVDAPNTVLLNSGQTAENSKCKIFANGSSWTVNGLDGILTVNVQFKSGFEGNRVFWASASDVSGGSPWAPLATRKVGPLTDLVPPLISSVSSGALTSTTATIDWRTSEPARTNLEYGLSPSYGLLSPLAHEMAYDHQHHLSNLLPNQTYYYRVVSSDASGNTSTMSGQFTAEPPPETTELEAFRKCLSIEGTGPECVLAGGTEAHEVGKALPIQRSNIIIYGDGIDLTTLKRKPGFSDGPLMKTDRPVENVFIQALTFDGNRGMVNVPHNAELEIGDCTGCRITSVGFRNSPHMSLAVSATGASRLSLRISEFSNSAHFGLWSGQGNCAAVFPDACLYVYSNTFRDNSTNAIYLESSRANIGYNTFLRNHGGCLFNAPGGQIDLDAGANNISVFYNTIMWGPSCGQYWAVGIELHGSNLSIYDNIIENNAGEGIYMEEVNGVEVFSNYFDRAIQMNNRRGSGFPGCGSFPGVRVHSKLSGRPTQNVLIRDTAIVNGHQGGVDVSSCGTSGPNSSSIQINNNCLQGNSGPSIRGTGFTQVGNQTAGCWF